MLDTTNRFSAVPVPSSSVLRHGGRLRVDATWERSAYPEPGMGASPGVGTGIGVGTGVGIEDSERVGMRPEVAASQTSPRPTGAAVRTATLNLATPRRFGAVGECPRGVPV